jgi:hypothetical protein
MPNNLIIQHLVENEAKEKCKVVSNICESGGKGKGRKGTYVLTEKKMPFVGLEPTPSAIRADVLIKACLGRHARVDR